MFKGMNGYEFDFEDIKEHFSDAQVLFYEGSKAKGVIESVCVTVMNSKANNSDEVFVDEGVKGIVESKFGLGYSHECVFEEIFECLHPEKELDECDTETIKCFEMFFDE